MAVARVGRVAIRQAGTVVYAYEFQWFLWAGCPNANCGRAWGSLGFNSLLGLQANPVWLALKAEIVQDLGTSQEPVLAVVEGSEAVDGLLMQVAARQIL